MIIVVGAVRWEIISLLVRNLIRIRLTLFIGLVGLLLFRNVPRVVFNLVLIL